MQEASFTVTLHFEGFRTNGEHEDALARDIRQVANSTAREAMCEPWRLAFRPDETTVDGLELSAPDFHTFDVTVRPVLVARISANGPNADRVRESIEQTIRDVWGFSTDINGVHFNESHIDSVEAEHFSTTADPEGAVVDVA